MHSHWTYNNKPSREEAATLTLISPETTGHKQSICIPIISKKKPNRKERMWRKPSLPYPQFQGTDFQAKARLNNWCSFSQFSTNPSSQLYDNYSFGTICRWPLQHKNQPRTRHAWHDAAADDDHANQQKIHMRMYPHTHTHTCGLVISEKSELKWKEN